MRPPPRSQKPPELHGRVPEATAPMALVVQPEKAGLFACKQVNCSTFRRSSWHQDGAVFDDDRIAVTYGDLSFSGLAGHDGEIFDQMDSRGAPDLATGQV